MHTHTTGYATWVTLESRLHNSGAGQSFPVSFNRASFSNHLFFIDISHIFSARVLSSLVLNPPSELPIIKLIKTFSILMVEETGVPMRKPSVRGPRRKSLLYGATYLVPRDIGYRPVTQTHQTRREPLCPHVPHLLSIKTSLFILIQVKYKSTSKKLIKRLCIVSRSDGFQHRLEQNRPQHLPSVMSILQNVYYVYYANVQSINQSIKNEFCR
jgi:hypothetical protein